MVGLVGPIAGPLPFLPEGSSATLADMTGAFDVAIGGIGFRLAVSDEAPYERATAQFRKEQADQSEHYGDHSLLGWWVVSQMSFHHGAGIRFYDPTDEVTLHRFADSDGLDPFSVPGEVALGTKPTDIAEYTGTVTTASWGGAGNGYTAVLDGNTLRYLPDGGALGSIALTSTHAAAAPDRVYVTTDTNDIWHQDPVGGGAAAQAYSHSAAWAGIWYAKDRLWAVDVDGNFYHLSPQPPAPPVAVAAADLAFKAGRTWGSDWVVAATPGPLLVGNGPRIYAVAVADDGTVPQLSGPVQVAELPTGETLRGMIYHLGFLVMSTSHGFRAAVVDDRGAVTYGPLLKEWAAASSAALTGAPAGTTMATHGSSVYLAGSDGEIGTAVPTVYRVDLARQVGDGLEFGWTVEGSGHLDGAHSSFGLATWQGRHILLYGADQVASFTPGAQDADSGTLTTAMHRMGTLEPKKFHSVQVRVGGTGGTVRVSKVTDTGSIVSLYTIDVTESTGETITLSTVGPSEVIGLRFTLSPGGGGTPKLIGYQIKALPAPRRQRLIRLPLQLHDVEKRGPSRPAGHMMSAWERLSALEEMEESGRVFSFQDYRTGEVGEVYIESIEHRGLTPAGRRDSGFGGIVFLTVRKL